MKDFGHMDKKHYVMNMALGDLYPRYNDSSRWRVILKAHELTKKCVHLCNDGEIQWVGHGTQPTLDKVIDTIRV